MITSHSSKIDNLGKIINGKELETLLKIMEIDNIFIEESFMDERYSEKLMTGQYGRYIIEMNGSESLERRDALNISLDLCRVAKSEGPFNLIFSKQIPLNRIYFSDFKKYFKEDVPSELYGEKQKIHERMM